MTVDPALGNFLPRVVGALHEAEAEAAVGGESPYGHISQLEFRPYPYGEGDRPDSLLHMPPQPDSFPAIELGGDCRTFDKWGRQCSTHYECYVEIIRHETLGRSASEMNKAVQTFERQK